MKDEQTDNLKVTADRRAFMKRSLAAAGIGAGILAKGLPAFAQQHEMSTAPLSAVAMPRFYGSWPPRS